jgi:two-component system, cell cycle response regulator
VDIDLFKTFNDQYGHLAGDGSLRAIGAAMREVLRRPADMATRYGGEEFAILLTETDVAGAIQIVGDMQAAVRKLAMRRWPARRRDAKRRCEPWKSDRNVWMAVEAPLYEAKARGRDTFTVHPNVDSATPAFLPKNAA